MYDAIHDAIEIVLSHDLPDEAVPQALAAQAALMAGVERDDRREEVAS
jgi:hypothetical protein